MPEMSLEHVTNNYLDVLREIGNIGAGNAMTALSQMLQSKVDMQVPQVRLLEFSEGGPWWAARSSLWWVCFWALREILQEASCSW